VLHIRTTLLASSVAIAGCRSTAVPNPVLQPAVIATASDTSTRSTWVLTPDHQPHTYHSVSQVTVKELSNSTNLQNTIETTTIFTISLNQSHTPLTISGHIDTVKIHRQNQSSTENSPFSLPLFFEGELNPLTLTVSIKNPEVTDSCSPSISSILDDLHTLIISYPLRLARGFTWKDSTLVNTCTTDGIVTKRKTTQSFRVVGEKVFNTTRGLLLQRLDSTHISGDGSEHNHQIHIEGTGTGIANIYINPITTAALGAELVEKLEIAVTNSGKTRHFIQDIRQTLQALN